MGKTTHESVAAAIESLEAGANGESTSSSADVGVGVADSSGPPDVGASNVSQAEGAGGVDGGASVVGGGDSSGERARDPATGQFTKTETPKAARPAVTPKPVAAKPATTGTPTPAVVAPSSPKYKAPQAWSPALREKWGGLPEDVQEYVDKREREITKGLQEAARPREFHQKFQETVAPYLPMIQSEGGDPVRVVGSLLQTAYELRSGTPDRIAAGMADMVRRFGVGRFGPQFIEALAKAIDGEGGAPQIQPQFDPVAMERQITQRVMQQFQQRQAQMDLEQLRPELEFLDDGEPGHTVRDDMQALMAVAAQSGRALSPKDAYNRALQLHPDIVGILKQREEAESAKAVAASTQRAQAAATPAKSTPAPQVGNGVKTTREAVAAAWDRLSR